MLKVLFFFTLANVLLIAYILYLMIISMNDRKNCNKNTITTNHVYHVILEANSKLITIYKENKFIDYNLSTKKAIILDNRIIPINNISENDKELKIEVTEIINKSKSDYLIYLI